MSQWDKLKQVILRQTAHKYWTQIALIKKKQHQSITLADSHIETIYYKTQLNISVSMRQVKANHIETKKSLAEDSKETNKNESYVIMQHSSEGDIKKTDQCKHVSLRH